MVDVDSDTDCRWYIRRQLFIDPVGCRLNADSRSSNRPQRTGDSVARRLTVDADIVGYEVDLWTTIKIDN